MSNLRLRCAKCGTDLGPGTDRDSRTWCVRCDPELQEECSLREPCAPAGIAHANHHRVLAEIDRAKKSLRNARRRELDQARRDLGLRRNRDGSWE